MLLRSLRNSPAGSKARQRFEHIYNTIRDRICLLEYEPGLRLSEEELALEFKVSRTPVRRVLSRLEAEGLVESRHGVGTFVTDIDFKGLEEVYRLRMELAELIGQLNPLPRTEADLDRIRRILSQCDELGPEPDARGFARLNMSLFQELSKIIGNEPLKVINESLYYLTARIWLASLPHLNLADEVAVFRREIMDVLAALEIGDLESVGHIRRTHISMSFARLKRYAAAG
jgi:DNA-binding GntR family transcriptional regulator